MAVSAGDQYQANMLHDARIPGIISQPFSVPMTDLVNTSEVIVAGFDQRMYKSLQAMLRIPTQASLSVALKLYAVDSQDEDTPANGRLISSVTADQTGKYVGACSVDTTQTSGILYLPPYVIVTVTPSAAVTEDALELEVTQRA